jgi:N-terminal half of MaoC dehydratase
MAIDKFPIEAGHIMTFARAIGDANPIYYDEGYAQKTEAGGIIAPPTFTQSSVQFDPDYVLRPKIGQPWFGSGREPSGTKVGSGDEDGGKGRGLHAEQHFEYNRAIHPGDVLTVIIRPGKRWEKEGRRSGKLIFSETIIEYRNQKGELVITARAVGVVTERAVDQG